MISICCVGFASLDVVCDELNDCSWNVGLQQLSDKCLYVYCVESFSVTVECCILYPCSVSVFGMLAVM